MQGSLSASLNQNRLGSDFLYRRIRDHDRADRMVSRPVWPKTAVRALRSGVYLASVLCELAQNIAEMVAFRLLQGAFGAALVPLSQSVMLDLYPMQQRGSAMAIWGIGVMLGFIMVPTLGAWLTDNYSWHWVFFIIFPIGILTVLGLLVFMPETARHAERRFTGSVSLRSPWQSARCSSCSTEASSLAGSTYRSHCGTDRVRHRLLFLPCHSLTATTPFIRFDLFRDRNFVAGASSWPSRRGALWDDGVVTPFMQNIMGYPIVTAGLLLAARGVGTLVAMIIVGGLLNVIEPRYLVLMGLALATWTLHQMVGFTDQPHPARLYASASVQGFGLGLVFVPLSTVAFTTLPGYLRTRELRCSPSSATSAARLVS